MSAKVQCPPPIDGVEVPTLLVMRHAKSDWSADYETDHDRPLNTRGVRSAKLMGRVLTDRGLVPNAIITSTAVRARTTAELASEEGAWRASIMLDGSIYGGGTAAALAAIERAPEVGHLMIVGHQPTWSGLVKTLTSEAADMKTATVAVVALDIERWSDIDLGHGRLTDILSPRDYTPSDLDV